jgi:cytochrome bd ubiquinol oxidase subunit I
MDALTLSRSQFATNITFHILFPAINIALCWVLVLFRGMALRSDDPRWHAAFQRWIKIFALTFALGVVSGVTMSFQFGTNWPGFMLKVGPVAGPLLAFEVLSAFFLEATFLGVMLFGANKVSARIHFFSCVLVAVGTTMSAFWILALNSWMHTPAGVHSAGNTIVVDSWWAVVFNSSFPYRLIHMTLASFITVGFLLAGLSAFRLLREPFAADAKLILRVGLIIAVICTPLQIVIGDLHGLNTLKHHPEKIAAMEAIWNDEQRAALRIFAWPDETAKENHYELKIPALASLILHHDADATVQGMNSFPDHPPVKPLFFGFRLMVGCGMLMLLASVWGFWRTRRGKQLSRRELQVFSALTLIGWVATIAGWYVTEIGRQPYLVSGILKTVDAVATHSSGKLASSLVAYVAVYAAMLFAYVRVIFYLAVKPIANDYSKGVIVARRTAI